MPNSWPIRRHLFALVFAIVLPMAVLLVYSLQARIRSNIDEASATTLSLAQIAAADAQRLVRDSGYLLAGMARRPKVRALDPADCDGILLDFKEFLPQFANVAIADAAGRVVCSALAQSRSKPASVAGTTWLKQVAEENSYIAGHPHIGPVSGKWVSVLAYPIQDNAGRFIGAIGLPVDLVKYRPLPAGVALPPGMVVSIVESSGTIIATSLEPEKRIGTAFADSALLARINADKHGQAWGRAADRSAVYGFTPVAGTEWFVVCSIPTSDILASVFANAARSGAVLVLLTLLGAILAYFVGRRIVAPVIGIADAAKAIASGNLDRRAHVSGPLEIADVAKQFNAMLDVRQRTEEKYRNLLECATDAIVMVDASRCIVFANAQAERMFGYAMHQLRGQPIELLIPERLREAHAKHTANYIAAPRAQQMAPQLGLLARRRDGTEFPVEVSLSPLMTDEGLVVSSIIRDVSERKRYEEKLAYMSQFDALTGLPNRHLLRDRLEQAIHRVASGGSRLGLILVDVDRFKEINETLGHQAGDEALKAVANRLADILGLRNDISRPGGDEFLVMKEADSEPEILSVAETIQKALDVPLLAGGNEIFLSASLGITVFPDDGQDAETLLKNVDVAMHQAKRDGRNVCRFYAPEMDARASERMAMESRLRRALSNNELLLHYQPQVCARSGKVKGLEALVRWNHPEIGMVPPVKFIGIAEETGLIEAFGEWILRTACMQNKAWQDMGLPPMVMAVNISAVQFRNKNLASVVQAALHDTGLDAAWLELEITESMLMQNPEDAEKALLSIAGMGVGVALDDFGTGYSSLAYLKRFPVSSLKIDRSFVRDIHTDPDDAAIVTAVVSLAKSLGMDVIAEGVELSEQQDFLRDLDCDSYQGYLFSKPLPAEECTALLETWAPVQAR
ncbi:EAL domain-containing protein [Herbaspirillum sp. HC18]|nr:EAL domain-containing protein [Herbaspirillum sp. HC18]